MLEGIGLGSILARPVGIAPARLDRGGAAETASGAASTIVEGADFPALSVAAVLASSSLISVTTFMAAFG